MIRISIAAASVALLAATTLASAQEYNGGVFGMQSVYGNTYNNSYNTYRRPAYNSYNRYNTYSSNYGRSYGNTWSSYAKRGYSYRCTYRCGDKY
jgi:phospholipase/lecithinase/hemolysin